MTIHFYSSQVALVVKNPPASAEELRDMGLIIEKIPWRRKWQPVPLFLPGESQGQRGWWATVHKVAQSWTHLKWQRSIAQHILLIHNPSPFSFFFFLVKQVKYLLRGKSMQYMWIDIWADSKGKKSLSCTLMAVWVTFMGHFFEVSFGQSF